MNKSIIFGVLLIVVFVLGMFIGKMVLTGNAVVNLKQEGGNYSWTTAICDQDKKECIDVLIKCENGKVVDMKPVSKLLEFNDSWKDPRSSGIEFCR